MMGMFMKGLWTSEEYAGYWSGLHESFLWVIGRSKNGHVYVTNELKSQMNKTIVDSRPP